MLPPTAASLCCYTLTVVRVCPHLEGTWQLRQMYEGSKVAQALRCRLKTNVKNNRDEQTSLVAPRPDSMKSDSDQHHDACDDRGSITETSVRMSSTET